MGNFFNALFQKQYRLQKTKKRDIIIQTNILGICCRELKTAACSFTI